MTQIPIDQAMQLAHQHHRAGRLAEAERIYRQVLAREPARADARAHYGLGIVLQSTGRPHEAIAAYREAIRLKPDFVEAHNNLGNALRNTGQLDEAAAAFRQTIRLKPDLAEAHNNLGNALKEMGQPDDAICAYRQAIALKPDYANAHSNLGAVMKETGRIDEAIAAYQQAIAAKPDHAEAHNNLGNAFNEIGRAAEEVAAYREALRIKPDYAAAHSNLLFASHCHWDFDACEHLVECERYDRQHAQPLRRFIRPPANDRDPDRKLRIGYVSPDFSKHPVCRFILPLLAAHDHKAFEIFAYAQVPAPDQTSAKVKACCDAWRNIVGVTDERVAEMIRHDRIDILIDLAGHTADNRLLIFAHKPAPVQITYQGYPGTTGLCAMDYRFTDAPADPPGLTDRFCSEKLIRLPRTNWCYRPPEEAPPVNELPAIANQYVTFGSFTNFAKLNDPTLKLWAEILRAAPGSKLLLKAKPLRCESVQQRVRQVMSDDGVESNRLELLGWVSSAAHLAQYNRLDIALDTYPYHGTTTTCESLWMGVPMVTLAGESHVSLVGASLLTTIGLPELIARSPQQYVQIAADLSRDLPRLAELRRTMRARMQASPLMDEPGLARDIEAVYRQLWRDWCVRT